MPVVKRKTKSRKNWWSGLKAVFHRWLASKGPVAWFCCKFVFLSALFYFVTLLPTLDHAVSIYVNGNSKAASLLLNLIGEHSYVSAGTIYSPQYAITVLPACAALEFGCFYCAIVLAFPAPWLKKILGVIIGFNLLTALNLLRIISLYFVGVHFGYSFFTAMHEQIWGIILTPSTIYLCLAWIRWARNDEILELPSTA